MLPGIFLILRGKINIFEAFARSELCQQFHSLKKAVEQSQIIEEDRAGIVINNF